MAAFDTEDLDLFAGLSKKELRNIMSLCTPLTIRAGRELVRQGSFGRECIVLLSGSVSVERDGVHVATLGVGDILGEIALLASRYSERNASATAVTECGVLAFSVDEFEQVITNHPTVAERITRTALGRLSDAAED